jgi:hypothetical protein
MRTKRNEEKKKIRKEKKIERELINVNLPFALPLS